MKKIAGWDILILIIVVHIEAQISRLNRVNKGVARQCPSRKKVPWQQLDL